MTVARDVGARQLLHDVQLIDGALRERAVAHLLALCALSTAAQPLRDTIERIFVRRPVAIHAEDLESAEEREAVVRMARAATGPPALREGFVRIEGCANGDRVRALLAELAIAPLGSVVPWLLCVEMFGGAIRCKGSTSDALAPYRESLRLRLIPFADGPQAAFLEWLGRRGESTLDETLRAGLDALRAAARLALFVRS
jgi:hypothetical protein